MNITCEQCGTVQYDAKINGRRPKIVAQEAIAPLEAHLARDRCQTARVEMVLQPNWLDGTWRIGDDDRWHKIKP